MKLIPFILFVMAMTGTPGPGNLTMMTIGEVTGFRGAVPFLLGTLSGFFALNVAVALGLGTLIHAVPAVEFIMKGAGTVYIIYLVLKIIRMNSGDKGTGGHFTFIEGLLIHPFSPKSWGMSLVGFSQFAEGKGDPFYTVLQFAVIFFVFQFLFHSLWCLGGSVAARMLEGRTAKIILRGTLVVFMAGAGIYAVMG